MAFTGILTSNYGSDEVRAFGGAEDFRSIPITLDATVGPLAVGTPLGMITANGTYAPYVDAHSDGTNVCSGILAESMQQEYPTQNGEPMVCSMWISGNFVLSKLTTLGLDANGIADLGAKSIPGRDTLIITGA